MNQTSEVSDNEQFEALDKELVLKYKKLEDHCIIKLRAKDTPKSVLSTLKKSQFKEYSSKFLNDLGIKMSEKNEFDLAKGLFELAINEDPIFYEPWKNLSKIIKDKDMSKSNTYKKISENLNSE